MGDRNWDEKREYRRKRRTRNQVIAYMVLAVFLVISAVAVVVGIGVISEKLEEKKHTEELARQLEEIAKEEIRIETPLTEMETAVEEEIEEVDWLEELVEATIDGMVLEDKVAGLFMITPEVLTGIGQVIQAGEDTRKSLETCAIGGLIYAQKNILGQNQLTQMLANVRNMSKYPLFLAVQEEGGAVRTVGGSRVEVSEVEDMWKIGEAGDSSKAYDAGFTMGSYLYELGFDMTLAPVADVVAEPEASLIGKRSFGGAPALVGEMAASTAAGIQDAGISACLKHFPDIGAVEKDTHKELVIMEKTLEELRETGFEAFRPGIEGGVHCVMVGHLSIPEITGIGVPSSLSEEMITNILRGDLGYSGIVMTDAMNVAAITKNYSSAEAAIQALKAGADMILMPENFQEAYEGVLAAVKEGVITEERINESLKRIYRVKQRNRLEGE